MNNPGLNKPIFFLKGVGPKITTSLENKNITTIEDILYLFPSKYIDQRKIKHIKELSEGENASIVARVTDSRSLYFRSSRRRGYEILVEDETGHISLKWFNFRAVYLKTSLKKGNFLFLSGKVSRFGTNLQIVHPDVVVLEDNTDIDVVRGIAPVYPSVDGVKQGILKRLIKEALSHSNSISPLLPEASEREFGLASLAEAVLRLHQPEDACVLDNPHNIYMKRVILEEYISFQSALWLNREAYKKERGIPLIPSDELKMRLLAALGFKLTNAQLKVIREIEEDMISGEPMNRLLQGDVGSGKTVCAVLACCLAIDNGYQAVFMAPTEILAEQHFLNVHRFFDALGIKVVFVRGGMKPEAHRNALKEIKNGDARVVVGTQALIEKNVIFYDLGLVIVDEQHRFGVRQRRQLAEKGFTPHILMMTATPIPRTLSMIVYGDLDISVIDEIPAGRHPVRTKVYTDSEKEKVYSLLGEEIQKGRRAFVVYPLVEDSERNDMLSAKKMAAYFQNYLFPSYRVGLMYGAMKADEKEETMSRFKSGRIDILVCTTVIEVGIDIPTASMIVIEHAERFGLSQLHQLRGRVGRGDTPSICALISASKKTELAGRRLSIMEKINDGFRIAEEDMLLRGVGEMLGARQSGIPHFRVGDINRDMDLMLKARNIVRAVLPRLRDGELKHIKDVISDRWSVDNKVVV